MPWGSTLKANYGNAMKMMKSFARSEWQIARGAHSAASRQMMSDFASMPGNLGIRGAMKYGARTAMRGAMRYQQGLGGYTLPGVARQAGWMGLGYGAYRGITSPFRGE